MSENPYAPQNQTADFGSELPAGPAKTSTLAIVAFVLSLVSIFLCCVPGVPAIGALLGVFAIIGISKSQGRRTGTGFAIAALVIGILLSVIQTVGLLVANQATGELTSLADRVESIESGDFDSVRASLPNVPAEQLTDASFIAFRDAYTADTGELVAPPESLLAFFGDLFASPAALEQISSPGFPYPSAAIPIPGEFANGPGYLLFIPDASPAAQPSAAVPMPLINIGVISESGTVYWLVDPNASSTGDTSPADEGDATDDDSEAEVGSGDSESADEPADESTGG